MREIKLKFWNKEHKKFISPYGLGYQFQPENGQVYVNGMNITDRFIILQYTGLTDKNGKEGFDSDIVGLEDTLGEQFYGVIKWLGDKKAMYVIEMSGSHYPMSLLSDCEIVGNIYENPELLAVMEETTC